jgi:ELWxxDGT repeat protein
MRTRLALPLLFAALPALAAGPASLVRDVDSGPPAAGAPAPAAPEQLRTAAAGVVFLTRADGYDPADRLWVTDGTAAGTQGLRAFCERGKCSGPPVMVAGLPGLAFFLAESYGDPPASPRLWRTDGTPGGTFPLTPPLSMYTYGYLPSAVFDGRWLVFGACNTTQQCSLWRTDGSAAGTVETPGIAAQDMVAMGGRVWFLGSGRNALGLWSTDGTDAGTRLVRRLPPGYLWLLTASGSRLFFMSGDVSGELWTSDGTAQGTIHVQTFAESGHDFLPRVTNYLHPLGDGSVVFPAVRDSSFVDLWRSDGTRSGTRPLTRFADGSLGSYFNPGLRNDQITASGGRVLFVADNGISGPRLWSSRGWLTSTAPVTGCPEGCPALLPESSLVALGNHRVLFAARDLAHGAELWTSDGSGPGTRLVADLCPGPCDSSPSALTAAAGAVWLRATISGIAGTGGVSRLVRTDGTAAGTAVLAPLPAGPTGLDLATLGSRVVFAGADADHGPQPWVTDGTPEGTRPVGGLPGPRASSDPRDLTVLGNRVVFTANDGGTRGVWLADASGASPLPLPSAGPAGASQVTAAGGLAFFTLDEGDGNGADLWRTDGTSAGTVRLAAFPGQRLSALHDFGVQGGRLLFLVAALPGDPPSFAFWTSDGTAAGTAQAFRAPDDTLQVIDVAVLGGGLYFAALRETTPELFRSDGTAAGTHPILDLGCPCSEDLVRYTILHGTVYFEIRGGFSVVFRTDGTAAGTVAVYPPPGGQGNPPYVEAEFPTAFAGSILFLGRSNSLDDGRFVLWRGLDGGNAQMLTAAGLPFSSPYYDPEFTPVGGTLFFRAQDAAHGMELWKTDGTPPGTVLVRDVVPGADSSDPKGLTVAGGRLYFSARDGLHGRELWTSDGTARGTRRVQDIAPGPSSSSPSQLTPLADHLFFTADDGVTGRELWGLPIP